MQQTPPQNNMAQSEQQESTQQAWQMTKAQKPEDREQTWTPPRRQEQEIPPQQPKLEEKKKEGVLLELGDGISLNLPIREKMRLDEFLRIADRIRELKKIDHN